MKMGVKKLILLLFLATCLGTASFSQACYTDDDFDYGGPDYEEQVDSLITLLAGLLIAYWDD